MKQTSQESDTQALPSLDELVTLYEQVCRQNASRGRELVKLRAKIAGLRGALGEMVELADKQLRRI